MLLVRYNLRYHLKHHSGKQLIADKLNAFISPENRTPTYPGTSTLIFITELFIFLAAVVVAAAPHSGKTPQVLPPYSGVPPPYSGPVVYPATPVPVNTNIVNDLPSVTSQYLQELISPLPSDDQSSIMALFYSRPVVIQECVRDIKDTDLLRSTLAKLAKQ